MKKLSLDELGSLISLTRNVFDYMNDQRIQNPLAIYIQYPKITPFLSESLALHLIERNVILPGYANLRLGNRHEADIVAIDCNGLEVSIEVKGTGSSAWVFMSDKDYDADVMVWICFDDYFENPDNENINVFVFNPSRIPERRSRITIQVLRQWVGDNMQSFQIHLENFLNRR